MPTVSRTRSFSTVFLIEMWERFGYYGMQALIIYYMVQRLGLNDDVANLTWSAAAALIYVSPAIGGWVGDKFFGTRHTMLLGAFVLAIGYALMVVPSQSPTFLFVALGVIVVGNGLFKANAGNLVRKIYEGDDTKIDSAFTIYYMAVNIGSMVSMLLTPIIKNYFNAPFHGQLTWLLGDHASALFGSGLGWHMAFAVCCVGLLVGLGNYMVMRQTLNHIGSDPDHKPMQLWKLLAVLAGGVLVVLASTVILKYGTVARWFVYIAAAFVAFIFIYLITSSERREKPGLIIALILVIETVFFFIFYQQMSTSLNLFALRNVNPAFDVFGLHLWNWDPAQFQAFNPIWIFILSPILAVIYTHYAKRGKDFSIASKFAIGFLAVAIGFFVYGAAGHFTSSPGMTTSWVMVWGYGFGSLGELLTSGLGLAFIARYVPARMGGFMMGAYFVASGVAQYAGGFVANYASIPDKISDFVHNAAVTTAPAIQKAIPDALQLSLGDFRDWMTNTGNAAKVMAANHLPAYASLPASTQQSLAQFNEQLNVVTMPIYTNLFFWLGVAGVACTIVALAVLPLLRKLDAQHAAHMKVATAAAGMPDVRAEQ
ncbi:MAG TPA: oligopeptide:H+ symporter [Rhodanobacteraceae bacterium]|nr:oligopeptide:H+ symporter [Rhodanobacteraceae bacterium]